MRNVKRRSLVKMVLATIPATALSQLATGQGLSAGIKVNAGEDRFKKSRTIGVSGTAFKVATQDTLGALFVMEQSNKTPGGPPRHLHHEQDEFWYVMTGEYVFEVGTDRFQAQTGDCVLGPRNIPHSWAFIGDSPGRLLIAFTPAGKMQEWFERDRKKGAYMNDENLYRAFGMELVGPPLSLKQTLP
jgi:mannose-6-phosphate isomerase-like protein (cupin superfamily)